MHATAPPSHALGVPADRPGARRATGRRRAADRLHEPDATSQPFKARSRPLLRATRSESPRPHRTPKPTSWSSRRSRSRASPESPTTLQAASSPGSLSGRLLTIPAGVTVLVRDLVLRYGSVAGPGAGIHNQGDLTLERVELRDNATDDSSFPDRLGGAIYNASSVRLRDSLVHYNFALPGRRRNLQRSGRHFHGDGHRLPLEPGGAVRRSPVERRRRDPDSLSAQPRRRPRRWRRRDHGLVVALRISRFESRLGRGRGPARLRRDRSKSPTRTSTRTTPPSEAAPMSRPERRPSPASRSKRTPRESGAALAHFSPVTLDLVNVTIGGNTAVESRRRHLPRLAAATSR